MFEPEVCEECQNELRDNEYNEDDRNRVLCDDCAQELGIEKEEYDYDNQEED